MPTILQRFPKEKEKEIKIIYLYQGLKEIRSHPYPEKILQKYKISQIL